jgi:hypothetical protein
MTVSLISDALQDGDRELLEHLCERKRIAFDRRACKHVLSLAPLFSTLGNQFNNENLIMSGSGTSWTQDYFAVDQYQPVTVVLVWSDAPAIAGATNTLVNDLDLEVDAINPGGCVYRMVGNDMSPSSETSVALNCAGDLPRDSANNVEVVRFTPGVTNTFRVIVRATSLTAGAVPNFGTPSQDFAV